MLDDAGDGADVSYPHRGIMNQANRRGIFNIWALATMKAWKRILLFIGIFLSHVLLTVMILSNMIGCGAGDCPNSLNYIWSRVLGFPLFSIVEIVGKFSIGNHYSGVFLSTIMPVNSLVAAAIIYYLLFWFKKRIDGRA